jgi:hypothetical protein
MVHYSALLGRRVEVQYRAGDIFLPATGTLVGDSGRSIFLEEHIERQGQMKHFRWEIPYQCILRIEEKPEPTPPPVGLSAGTPREIAKAPEKSAERTSAGLFPLRDHPKEA